MAKTRKAKAEQVRSNQGEDAARWAAVIQRDRKADGRFFYSVRTTGVYCRPSCPSRLARRENVAFHESCEVAEQAGFRACKRCKPREMAATERNALLVRDACRSIDTADEAPSLARLAASAGMSIFHFHRLFRNIVGVTPKAYAQARRAERTRRALGAANTVTAAIYDAGFSSSGRFYAAAADMLGMRPSDYRRGGDGLRIEYAAARCSLGWVVVGATEKGLCAVQFIEGAAEAESALAAQFPRARLSPAGQNFGALVEQVIRRIEAPCQNWNLPLDVRGTVFQQKVWSVLRRVPAGRTVTYAELASAIGAPRAVRAVARACASNPIAVAVPCHRVVRSDGSRGGYRWGADKKGKLLANEEALKPTSKKPR